MSNSRPIPHSTLYLSPATGYWHVADVRRMATGGLFALCSLPLRDQEHYSKHVPEAGGVSPFAVCQDCLKLWNALPEPPRIVGPEKEVEMPDRTEILCEIADMLKTGRPMQDIERAKALGLLVLALEVGLLREAVEKTFSPEEPLAAQRPLEADRPHAD